MSFTYNERKVFSATEYSDKLNSSDALKQISALALTDVTPTSNYAVTRGEPSMASTSDTAQSSSDLSSSSIQAQDFVKVAKEELKVKPTLGESSNLQDVTLHKLDFPDSRLFGRDKEVSRIRNLVRENIGSDGENNFKTPLLLIGGSSGTGKSVLVHASLEPLRTSSGNLFFTGRFDLLQRAQPYTAFVGACEELVERILKSSDKTAIVDRLVQTINHDGQLILTEALPTLTPLFESCNQTLIRAPNPESSSRMENRAHRFHHYARIFFQTLCQALKGGVVLVLDNLQWSDGPSIELAHALLTDSQNMSLVVIATCRTDELPDSIHERLNLWKLDDHIIVEEFKLGNLNPDAIQNLVDAGLRSSSDLAEPLATIVYDKTHGNPFFAVQFLQSLVHQELLVFQFGLLKWTWKEEQIRALAVTDNVADLMEARLCSLPALSLFYLQVAATLGQTFDLTVLWSVLNSLRKKNHGRWMAVDDKEGNDHASLKFLDTGLDQMVEDGLLTRLVLDRFSFVHDQIQNAALRLVSEEDVPYLQRDIGQHLLGTTAVESGIEQSLFFLAVDLCNLGAKGCSENRTVRLDLAQQNLLAGQRAMKRAAFSAALSYFQSGLGFLGSGNDQCWNSHYALSLDLSCGAAEAANCNGDFEIMQTHIDSVIASKGPPEDKYRAKVTMILSLGVQKRFDEAIDIGLSILKEMNVADFPKFPSPTELKKEANVTKAILKGRSKEAILNLPPIPEKSKAVFAMSVIDRMMTMAYFVSTKLVIVMNMRSVQWSVEYGLSKFSPLAFAIYSMAVASLGDTKARDMYGDVALTLSYHLNAVETNPRTIHTIYCYVHHWKNDMRESLRPLLYGFQLGLEVGDVEMAMYNLGAHDRIAFACGSMKLKELGNLIEEHLSLCHRYKQDASLAFLSCLNQMVLNLQGHSKDAATLNGTAMNETKIEADAMETNNSHLMMMLDFLRMQLRFWFGDIQGARVLAEERTNDYGIKKSPGHSWAPRNHFFRALIFIDVARNRVKQRKYLQLAEEALRTLEGWANPNSFHMIKLIQAELGSFSKTKRKKQSSLSSAEQLYQESIVMASRRGCIHDRALAHELATRYYFAQMNDTYWAKYHLDNAIQTYKDWGATAKVDQLKRKFGGLQ